MAAKSDIEWTNSSWTPIRARNRKTGKVGWHCEHATTGCEFCYAEGLNKWFGTGLLFKPGHRKDIEIFLDEEMLTAPLRWKRPRMVFCCSMTDLFADFITDEWIDKIFALMALCPQHTFQVMTKRPERMRDYMLNGASNRAGTVLGCAWSMLGSPSLRKYNHGNITQRPWPLPNVWLGVSCERQQEADERRDYLGALAKQGWLTFVSYEPAIGGVSWTGWEFLKWMISGGEGGPNARSSHPNWHRVTRDWCCKNNIPYFFKQWGAFVPADWPASETQEDEELRNAAATLNGQYMRRVGKKAAGRLLDGREWNEFPDAARSAGTLTEPVEPTSNPLS